MNDPITAALCQLLHERAERGLVKYGHYLHESADDLIRHALEESLDLNAYLFGEILRLREQLHGKRDDSVST